MERWEGDVNKHSDWMVPSVNHSIDRAERGEGERERETTQLKADQPKANIEENVQERRTRMKTMMEEDACYGREAVMWTRSNRTKHTRTLSVTH